MENLEKWRAWAEMYDTGMTLAEVAEIAGCSIGAIHYALKRAFPEKLRGMEALKSAVARERMSRGTKKGWSKRTQRSIELMLETRARRSERHKETMATRYVCPAPAKPSNPVPGNGWPPGYPTFHAENLRFKTGTPRYMPTPSRDHSAGVAEYGV